MVLMDNALNPKRPRDKKINDKKGEYDRGKRSLSGIIMWSWLSVHLELLSEITRYTTSMLPHFEEPY